MGKGNNGTRKASLMMNYFGNFNFAKINNALRNNNISLLPAELKNTITELDNSMRTRKKDIIVNRKANEYFLKSLGVDPSSDIETVQKKLTGLSFTDKAYVSTSYSNRHIPYVGEFIVKMEIDVPKHIKGMYSPRKEEDEFLIHRGATFKINKVIKNEEGILMKVIVIK